MKKSFITFFIISLFFINISFSQTENIYNNSIGACVSVYGLYYDNNGKPESYSTGTGFFIDVQNGIFCTAFHVVAGAQEVAIDYGYETGIIPNDFINLTKVYPIEKRSKYYWIDESRDIIIFKIPELSPKQSLNLSTTMPTPGESIHTIGNTFGDYTMKFSSGEISQVRETNMMKWIISEFTGLGGGNSGGPVFNKYGEVVGLVDALDTRNSTIIWIIPSMYISYLENDSKNRGNSGLSKELEDFIVTPEMYSKLIPFDSNKFHIK